MNRVIITLCIVSLVFVSCKRKKQRNDPTVKDFVTAESYFNEVQSVADDGSDGNMTLYKGMYKDGCADVNISNNGNEYVMVIDFGDVNCLCQDGRERRGIILSTWTGAYGDSGTVITHTPDDYFIDDVKLEGTKVVENLGTNNDGNTHFSIEIDGTVTLTDGTELEYESSRIREWIAGKSTPFNWLDDEYLLTGTATGTNSNGTGYFMEVTTPLHIKLNCPHIVEGILEITPYDLETRVVDYGSGTCDSEVVVTIGNYTYNVGGG